MLGGVDTWRRPADGLRRGSRCRPREAAERPEWLENVGGQVVALIVALLIAMAAGLGHHRRSTVRARSRSTARSSRASLGDKNGFGYVLANADPLIFSALAVAVCFKGGMFNIGVEGQYIVGDGDGVVGGAEARLPPGPAADDGR